MPDLYDRLEARVPQTREAALFRDLRHILTVAKSRVPALRAQLKGIDLAKVATRAQLARIPIMRLHDLAALQADAPPFGGTCAARPSALKQILLGPGFVAVPEGQAKDWWGAGRALFAAGLRKGDLLLNCLSYETGPFGHMMASGACAIGAPVIPLGAGPLDVKIEAVARLRPTFFCGAADHLKALLDCGAEQGRDMSSLTCALVIGPMTAGLRSELGLRNINVRMAFATPELGIVAYECSVVDGLTLNEGLILELVEPESGTVVEPFQPGEMVITRLNADYPLLRFGTGAVSCLLPHPSTSGRTNLRLRLPTVPDAASADFQGTRLHPGQLVEIARRHPTLGRLRLVLRRGKEQDVLILRAEHRGDEASLSERLSETLHKVTQMRGTVEIVTPGSLTEDEAIIVDERPLN